MEANAVRQNRILILGALLAAVSILHYFTPVTIPLLHQVYRRLYYIPVLFGAYWFGIRGGLITSTLSAVLYLPHILFHWRHVPGENAGQYGEMLMFFVVGAITGYLADSERRQRIRYQEAAEERSEALRRLEESVEQIRRADRLSAVGQLSAGIAHEIRNPLGSISGAVELLLDDLPEDHPSREFAGIVRTETARLQRLLDDFLSFARPSAPSFGAVSIQRILPQITRLLGKEADAHGARLEVSVPEDLPEVRADEGQVSQVLLNLVLNALQAGGDGLTVRLEAGFADEGMVRIDVADDGPGIPEEALQKLYDPFFTTRPEGTGLGLSVAYSIMESHGGRITARNRPEGGALFELLLPVWEG